MKNKVAFVLIDGVGDVSIPSLGLKTPLEAAKTPVLDAIAGKNYSESLIKFHPPHNISSSPPSPLLNSILNDLI
jgi:2,3-bisphosphoglycerate-independent phosphoglycerate mutase